MSGSVLSVNVAEIREIPRRGVNVDGDEQADRSVHGGPDKALYAYPLPRLLEVPAVSEMWRDWVGWRTA